MIIASGKTAKFFRSAFLNVVSGIRFLNDGVALSASSSKSVRHSEIETTYVQDGADAGFQKGNEKSNQNRPLIFLWSRDQPAGGQGLMVRLPECDVVYKDETPQKKTRRKPQRSQCHYLCSPSSESAILNYYLNGNDNLQHSSSVFCLYNPGDSTLPQKLVEAKARRVIILEAPKSPFLDKWEKFAADPNKAEKTIVKSYDFNRFAAGRIRDIHRNKGVDSVCQALTQAGAVSVSGEDPAKWWGEGNTPDAEPPVRIMGVAEPFKEHGLFATLLYTRITRSSIYEFGPVEVTAAVTAQQYLDFHPDAAKHNERRRRNTVPKLVHWRARLYQYLFRINVVAEDSVDAFSPQIPTKNRLKYDRDDDDSKALYGRLGIDKDKMYWVSLRPRWCDELETLVSRDYGAQSDVESADPPEHDRRHQFPHLAGFAYMHKLLSRYRKDETLWQFIKNYFPEADQYELVHESDMSVDTDRMLTALNLNDLLEVYTQLAIQGGRIFYNSPFYKEAQEFVDQILCPTGLEPKLWGKKKS